MGIINLKQVRSQMETTTILGILPPPIFLKKTIDIWDQMKLG
jgi:hypothetical protein